MKGLIIGFSLFFSIGAFAQSNNTDYIIDGILMAKNPISPDEILETHGIKGKLLDEIVTRGKLDSIVVIKSKHNYIREYQKKFSFFSKEYENYIIAHKNNDTDCGYILDGTPLWINGKNNMAKKLYEVSSEKIKKVYFIENTFYNGGDSREFNLFITTKD